MENEIMMADHFVGYSCYGRGAMGRRTDSVKFVLVRISSYYLEVRDAKSF